MDSAHFEDKRVWNVSNLNFDVSRSPKVTYDGAIGLDVYHFLSILNSNTLTWLFYET